MGTGSIVSYVANDSQSIATRVENAQEVFQRCGKHRTGSGNIDPEDPVGGRSALNR